MEAGAYEFELEFFLACGASLNSTFGLEILKLVCLDFLG